MSKANTSESLAIQPSLDPEHRRALEFLYGHLNYEKLSGDSADRYPFRLQRIRQLLERLDLGHLIYHPDRDPKIPVVHIAGTKGKGSTASMVASVLTESGIKTGLYTSPHLNRLEERFRIDGQEASESELIALVDRIKLVVAEIDREGIGVPTFFDLVTALAFCHFATQGCEAIVLEVGLGGRLDSTNICSPSVTAITSIGWDHQNILGDTLEKIAAEKAGIIKPSIPVVSGVKGNNPAGVIREIAEQSNSPLYEIDRDFMVDAKPSLDWGSELQYRFPVESAHYRCHLPLDGHHQAVNAAVAMTCVQLLLAQGTGGSVDTVQLGIEKVGCRGRIERFELDGRTVIVDTAHNEDSIDALVQCLTRRFGDQNIVTVFGSSRDKDSCPMLASLSQCSKAIVLTRFHDNPRYQDVATLLKPARDCFEQVRVEEDPVGAMGLALEMAGPDGIVVACGSFFLTAEIRPWICDQVSG